MVRAAAAYNTSPSLESQRQIASYFHYPLVAGILDLAKIWPTQEALLKMSRLGISHSYHDSICVYHIYLAPTAKEELCCA